MCERPPEGKAQEHFCPTGQVGSWGAMSTLPSETHSDHSILNHLKAEHITLSRVPRDSNSWRPLLPPRSLHQPIWRWAPPSWAQARVSPASRLSTSISALALPWAVTSPLSGPSSNVHLWGPFPRTGSTLPVFCFPLQQQETTCSFTCTAHIPPTGCRLAGGGAVFGGGGHPGFLTSAPGNSTNYLVGNHSHPRRWLSDSEGCALVFPPTHLVKLVRIKQIPLSSDF